MQNYKLQAKYRLTSIFYDILDYPWERQYRQWRPRILSDVTKRVLEAGVGTGRNLEYYPAEADVVAIDLSEGMLRRARKRAKKWPTRFEHCDATDLSRFANDSFDWYISTFMYCVMPDELQLTALKEMKRVLKPGGKFRLIEMVYSKDPALLRRQKCFAPFVEFVYGARFDRNTLSHIRATDGLEVTSTSFLKADTYLMVEGRKR